MKKLAAVFLAGHYVLYLWQPAVPAQQMTLRPQTHRLLQRRLRMRQKRQRMTLPQQIQRRR